MPEAKISVIVPVYKVEPYLRKCLDSIVGQTYRNLEIILVDDGSPDNCGAICDDYAAGDGRIKVIHQLNGGLSSARNAALEITTGDYIGFIDSDDWVETNMFETLLCGLIQTRADIVVCGRYEEYSDHNVAHCWTKVQVMEREEALGELLCDDRLQNLVWDKLYRQTLFEGIRFPEGQNFEDIAVMYRLFLQADRVACLPGIVYHYRRRSDSIVGDLSLKNRMSYYQMVWERYQALSKNWPQFIDRMMAPCAISAVGIWTTYLANSREERQQYRKQMENIAAFIRLYQTAALKDMHLGIAGRLVLHLAAHDTWWSFALSWLIGKLYQYKHGQAL